MGGAATGWLDAAGVIVEEGDEAAGGIDGTEGGGVVVAGCVAMHGAKL